MTGFFNTTEYLVITQLRRGHPPAYKISKSDPKNLKDTDMVIYFNLVLDNIGTVYNRKHYNFVDLMEQIGGLTNFCLIIVVTLMIPFTFKIHELEIFLDFEKKFEPKENHFLKKL